jgi:tRNA modification GTPase
MGAQETSTDTIYALSSARGVGGVAVVRVSGPSSQDSLELLSEQAAPTPRVASLRTLKNPATHAVIDHALVLYFKAPHSFTGEDVVEYHIHGGVAVTQNLLQALSLQPNHRMALAGEFTKRAFLNAKLDLTQAEGLNDLIHAETDTQAQQALEQMNGALFDLYEGWKREIMHVLALMEADLDFSDQDLPDDILLKITPTLDDVRTKMAQHLDDGRKGELRRNGVKLAILGAPNAGKSSLINLIAERDVAIVTNTAGTTRDALDIHVNINGHAVIITDTAGLRDASETSDSIEHLGMQRARARGAEADIKLLLFDAKKYPDLDPHTLNLIDDKSILAVNKIDCLTPDKRDDLPTHFVQISCATHEGLGSLLHEISSRCAHLTTRASPAPLLTRARHRDCVQDALNALNRAINAPLPELMAEDLRLSLRALGALTGRVDVEDILDKIFRDFCIGK